MKFQWIIVSINLLLLLINTSNGENGTDSESNVTLVGSNSSLEEVNLTLSNETYFNYSITNTSSTSNFTINREPHHDLNFASYDQRYDYCSCDLKPEFCDLNCCCDDDCDDEERQMFAYCESVKHPEQLDLYCFKEYPVYLNNTKRSWLIKESSSSLFCVHSDNVKNMKIYPDRKSVTTVQEYRKIITSLLSSSPSIFSWSHPHELSMEATAPFPSDRHFHYGDPIVATSVTARGVEITDLFRLPTSLIMSQGFCDTLRPVSYLKDSSYSCLRDIKDFQTECSSNQFLGSSIYYENIYINRMGASKSMEPETRTFYQIENVPPGQIKQPSKSTSPQVVTSKQQAMESKTFTSSVPNCVYLNECITIDWSSESVSPIKPRLVQRSSSSIICEGVVNTVNYTFYYHPKDGIDLVRLAFTFTSLTANQPLKQTYNVVFRPNESYMVNKKLPLYEFSGNAGYIFGRPILFRNSFSSSDNSSSSDIDHYKIPSLSMGNGQCSRDSKIEEIVKFGSNYRIGCMLNTSRFLVENQMCQSIQKEILNLLDGINKDLSYVAMFGNPNATNPADWIPILVDDEPQILQSDSVPRLTADERCPALVTGYSLDIYYAQVGRESQSQAKIISVVKKFNKAVDFRLRCHSLLCRHKANHYLIELSISVNYIDLTLPIETKFAPPPILRFQLPADFFYPFLTNSSHHIKGILFLHNLIIILFFHFNQY